jgi:hypothetical protein
MYHSLGRARSSAGRTVARRRRLRGLGDVCTMLASGNRVCGPTPTGLSAPLFDNANSWLYRRYPIPIIPGPPISFSPTPSNVPAWPARYPVPLPPIRVTGWGTFPAPGWGGNYLGPPTPAPTDGSGGLNLAQIQQLANTNPGALTSAQWAILQSAGTIASTLPYSSASQLAVAGQVPVSSDGSVAPSSGLDLSVLSTLYGPLPLWAWLLVGGGGLWLLSGRRGR